MKLAIITDSTCDLNHQELETLKVQRVPLYVNFKNKVFKDWLEINPKDITEGVAAGAGMPSTSQPSPQDFEDVYKAASDQGAEQILCLTISSELSGTYQSANIAKDSANVPVTVFDSRAASVGLGDMVKKAATLRDQGASLETIMKAVEHIRDTNFLLFCVETLDFLKKNGRIGGAQALLGSLLNIKPILTLNNGKVDSVGRARGTKKAIKDLIERTKAYASQHSGALQVSFVHIQDPAAADIMRQELKGAGVSFVDRGTHEIGAVIASHVGPGTFGMYMHTEPNAS